MTDFSTSLVEPETPEISTQLDAPRASDETVSSKPPVPEEKEKPVSRMDALKKAAEDTAPKEPVAEKPKEAPAEKVADDKAQPEPKLEDKPVEDKAKPVEQERRQRDHIEAPAKFLPRAKELWINAPREVKAEVQRVLSEAEQEVSRHSEAAREYEPIRQYAEMAKQSGTTLDAALDRYVRMENALRSNPSEGFRGLLDNMQMTPVQAIGHVLAAYNVRPEQLIQHMSQSPEQYIPQQRQMQAQQQERQPDPELASVKQQLAQMQEQMTAEQVIRPFAAENPRYFELQEDIAFFLQSGKVPASLSPYDRLAAAYDLAVRIRPQEQRQTAPEQHTQAPVESRAGEDFGGTKSVRGAPASGVELTNARKGKLSRGDALKAAMAELGVA